MDQDIAKLVRERLKQEPEVLDYWYSLDDRGRSIAIRSHQTFSEQLLDEIRNKAPTPKLDARVRSAATSYFNRLSEVQQVRQEVGYIRPKHDRIIIEEALKHGDGQLLDYMKSEGVSLQQARYYHVAVAQQGATRIIGLQKIFDGTPDAAFVSDLDRTWDTSVSVLLELQCMPFLVALLARLSSFSGCTFNHLEPHELSVLRGVIWEHRAEFAQEQLIRLLITTRDLKPLRQTLQQSAMVQRIGALDLVSMCRILFPPAFHRLLLLPQLRSDVLALAHNADWMREQLARIQDDLFCHQRYPSLYSVFIESRACLTHIQLHHQHADHPQHVTTDLIDTATIQALCRETFDEERIQSDCNGDSITQVQGIAQAFLKPGYALMYTMASNTQAPQYLLQLVANHLVEGPLARQILPPAVHMRGLLDQLRTYRKHVPKKDSSCCIS
eukprot:TRINITY_DN5208_c0_g1_i3.p1 TRINITY_DN5208_c0_g1~~TRINITY_DN5208_c0_g1_i3.p1  ORF type:complete len:441 (+),score=65.79 TRINITY_DN5208_c0_g1_i3:63-1385(+)